MHVGIIGSDSGGERVPSSRNGGEVVRLKPRWPVPERSVRASYRKLADPTVIGDGKSVLVSHAKTRRRSTACRQALQTIWEKRTVQSDGRRTSIFRLPNPLRECEPLGRIIRIAGPDYQSGSEVGC
jgi:hypothetical protein